MVRNLIFYTFLMFSPLVLANQQTWSQDSGVISKFYANNNGSVAISLDGGFPKASAAIQCSTAPGIWAGDTIVDPIVKSALLAAYSAGKKVTVTIEGCALGGGWFRLIDVYLE